MKYRLLLILLIVSFYGYGQDSLQSNTSESWKNLYVPKTLMRIGAGYQGVFNLELGFTRRKYSGEDLFVFGSAYYASIEWNPEILNNSENIYGLKFGGEISIQPLLLGAECKYQTNFYKADMVITPRTGIGDGLFTGSAVSNIYMCYGYNVSLKDRIFEEISRHQFALIINPVVLSHLLNKRIIPKNYINHLNAE